MLSGDARGLQGVLLHLAALEAHHAFAWITTIHLGAKGQTCVQLLLTLLQGASLPGPSACEA